MKDVDDHVDGEGRFIAFWIETREHFGLEQDCVGLGEDLTVHSLDGDGIEWELGVRNDGGEGVSADAVVLERDVTGGEGEPDLLSTAEGVEVAERDRGGHGEGLRKCGDEVWEWKRNGVG